jgi:hypothetical protein
VGAEVSYRHNTPLTSQVLGIAPGLPERGELVARIYSLTGFIAETGGLRHTKPLGEREWTADALAGRGFGSQSSRNRNANRTAVSWQPSKWAAFFSLQ